MRKMYVCLMVLAALLVCSPIAMSAVPVTSGLVLQLDTSDVTTRTDGGTTYVTSWNDLVGSNDAVQADETMQPILVSGITPALGSAVKFDGTDDYFALPTNFEGGTWTILAVYSLTAFDSGSGGRRIINFGYNDIDPGETTLLNYTTYSVVAGGATSGVRAISRDIAGVFKGANSGVPSSYAINNFYIAGMTNDSSSGTVSAYLHNQAGTVSTTSTTGADSVGSGNNLAFIGAGCGTTNPTPANFFNGCISEILVYNRVLDSAELTSVSDYLLAKHMPPMAYDPTPTNGGLAYDQLTTLKWIPTNGITSQSIYFSTDHNDVVNSAPAALKANLAFDANSYGPVDVKMSTTYYWRVNHVVGGSTVYGTVWSFATPAYYRIENFEDYTGTGSSGAVDTLRYLWRDGYSLAGQGLPQLGSNVALVANNSSITDAFQETTADEVRTLVKSMLFAFDNTGNEITFTYPSGSQAIYTPAYPYAEAKVDIASLPIGTDWTVQGDWTINVYFKGKTTNDTSSPLYLLVEDATGHVGDPIVYPTSADIAVADWHQWDICPGDLATNGVDLSNLSKLYIGFGDRNNPQIGGKGVVYFDDIRLHREAKLATDLNKDCKIDFADFNILALDWLMHAGCSN